MNVASIAQQCEGAHRDKDGWRAKCPVHNGKSNTSLWLTEEHGTIRVHCFSGCRQREILDALNLERTPSANEPEQIYSYHDAFGHLVFQVCRKPGKKFVQRRPHQTKAGEWVWNVKGVETVLYRLPEVLRAREADIPIYIVEGEKDVETLRRHNLVATCNPMGANKWEDHYTDALQGATCILLPDNDEKGREHADLVQGKLEGVVRRLTRIDLPGLADSGDVSDWLGAHSFDELQALCEQTPVTIEAPHLVLQPFSEIERREITWLWEPYVARGKLTFLEGDPGNGKTFVALAMATALSLGSSLPDQEGKTHAAQFPPAKTLFITAEDDLGDTIKPRLEDMRADCSKVIAVTGWTAGPEVHMFSFQQISLLEEAIRDQEIRLVIIDPIDAFLGPDVDMHRSNEVRPLMDQVKMVAEQTGCAIVFIRHWNKSGGSNARYRGLGSIAFTAAVRSVLVVGESLEDDRMRILAHAKTNTGTKGVSQVFSVSQGMFAWYGTDEIDADTLADQQPRKRQHQRKAATEWLKDLLKGGPVAAESALAIAQSLGLSDSTVKRAKKALGIFSERQGDAWYWRLPRSGMDEPF